MNNNSKPQSGYVWPDGALQSVNPATDAVDFSVSPLTALSFRTTEVTNEYLIILIQQGEAQVRYGCEERVVQAPAVMFCSPYQPFVFTRSSKLSGTVLRFTPEFHPLERDCHGSACNEVVFNSDKSSSLLPLDAAQLLDVRSAVDAVYREMRRPEGASRTLLFAYLQVLLVLGVRIRDAQVQRSDVPTHPDHELLRRLRRLIEEHFRLVKRPSDYAAMLFMTTRALNKVVKHHLRKTLTDLIQERIAEEARRELASTDRSVKEIALLLGFEDPYYFSRMFKKLSRISPEHYRNRIRQLSSFRRPATKEITDDTGAEYVSTGSTSAPVSVGRRPLASGGLRSTRRQTIRNP